MHLRNCRIEQAPQEHINALIKLTYLHLGRNKLTSIPNISHMHLLTTLDLHDNQIQEVPRCHISGLISLEELHLETNLMHTMPNISCLSNLTEVNFSENDITEVPANTLFGIPNLLTLTLTNNKISVIGDVSSLWAHVYIENNNLATLPDLYNMKRLTLMLEGNPLTCNQSLYWLRMWPWNKTVPSLDNANCATRSGISELMMVHPTRLKCFNGMTMVIKSIIIGNNNWN